MPVTVGIVPALVWMTVNASRQELVFLVSVIFDLRSGIFGLDPPDLPFTLTWTRTWESLFVICAPVGGLVAVASLWVLILFGLEQVNQRPALRWWVLLTGMVGLGLAGLALPTLIEAWRFFGVRNPWDLLCLLGPMVVGGCYLPGLMTGHHLGHEIS